MTYLAASDEQFRLLAMVSLNSQELKEKQGMGPITSIRLLISSFIFFNMLKVSSCHKFGFFHSRTETLSSKRPLLH